MTSAPLLQMSGISKSFGGVRVLDGVDFDVRPGEVHALIGENGAGKSTLMNVLAGRFGDYEGQVNFRGQAVRLASPRQALGLGIHIIFQELTVLPNLTVAENIMLGHEPGRGLGMLDRAALRERAQKTIERLGFDLPLDAEVGTLSAAKQCLVEIARAIHKDVSLLVFDEPTAALGQEDVQKLFAVIRELKQRGLGMVYISHRLAELPQIADRVTVLRDGKVVGARAMAECKPSDMTRMMLGRELAEMFPKRERQPGEPLLRVKNLTRPGVFEDISFELRAGEILGLAGLVGSGRTEIARAIVGADDATGECELAGKPLLPRRPDHCRQQGLCLVPENRKRDGNLTGRSIAENINAGILERLSGALGFLSPRSARTHAAAMISRMEVNPPMPEMEIQKLSGGNQQKVMVGRVLGVRPRVIIFDEPTQGIDVGTKAQIYRLLSDLAAQGCGILLISSEFIEVTELADRILIVRDGRLAGEWHGGGTDEDALFAECAGAS